MNKKPYKTGPRIRQTRPAAYRLKLNEAQQKFEDKSYIYSCEFCLLKFTQNSQFFRHMSTNHQSQQKLTIYQCNECKIVFSKKSNLNNHCLTNHQHKSKSKCDSCSTTFKSRYCLRRHLKLKQVLSENTCLKCQKKFVNKDLLLKHVRNKHTFVHTTFPCDTCCLQFKMEGSLISHLKRIHKSL